MLCLTFGIQIMLWLYTWMFYKQIEYCVYYWCLLLNSRKSLWENQLWLVLEANELQEQVYFFDLLSQFPLCLLGDLKHDWFLNSVSSCLIVSPNCLEIYCFCLFSMNVLLVEFQYNAHGCQRSLLETIRWVKVVLFMFCHPVTLN